MYHPGKVLEIFVPKDKNVVSNDTTIQAMLEMWDENLITVLVEPQITEIKKFDIVLVDYRPSPNHPVPKMTVTKVLRGKIAKDTWDKYKEHHKKLSNASKQNPSKVKTKTENMYVG